jgi:protein-L-isoaspartate(D-aspartate) O-methyltransferase
MDTQAELRIVRAAYASRLPPQASTTRASLQAFAAIPRGFLGQGPGLVRRWLRDYVPTPDADPISIPTM